MRPLPPGRVGRLLAAARAVALVITVLRLVGRRGTPPPARNPVAAGASVSVVIPARDEAARLGPCLAALRGASVAEVLVVDDRSTDGTAELARGLGARVVPGAPLPPGWAGKAWALQQGVEAASGEVVVTLDADTRPDARLPERLRDRLTAGADLVTVAGRFECPTAPAQALHAALLTTLVHRFGRPGPAGPDHDRVLANGQCTAFARAPFLAAGGMQPVRGALVEDVALARHLVGAGWRVELLDAPELLTVRMFEDLGDTWHGWGRSIALPGVEPRRRQLLDLAVVAAVQGLPLARLAARRADAVDLVALAVRAGTLVGTRRAFVHPGAGYWCSPLLDPLAVVRLGLSIARPSRTWRGRTYPAGPSVARPG